MLNPNHSVLYALIVICCAIEGALKLSDHAILVPEHTRSVAYFYGAFWPGLLDNWKPNFTAQPYTMFFTYGLLHGGLFHLAVNMVTLWSLGRVVLNRAGQANFIFFYISASLGGSAVFALMATSFRPMVGASGALFGLLGVILAWEYVDRRREREGLWDIAKIVALLVGLNLLLWWAMGGELAWQAHLGGFLVGWAAALIVDRMPKAGP